MDRAVDAWNDLDICVGLMDAAAAATVVGAVAGGWAEAEAAATADRKLPTA